MKIEVFEDKIMWYMLLMCVGFFLFIEGFLITKTLCPGIVCTTNGVDALNIVFAILLCLIGTVMIGYNFTYIICLKKNEEKRK